MFLWLCGYEADPRLTRNEAKRTQTKRKECQTKRREGETKPKEAKGCPTEGKRCRAELPGGGGRVTRLDLIWARAMGAAEGLVGGVAWGRPPDILAKEDGTPGIAGQGECLMLSPSCPRMRASIVNWTPAF